MQGVTTRHRVTHVGSLPRPASLLAAYDQRDSRTLSAAGFAAILDGALRDAVALQESCPLPHITDGDLPRRSPAHAMCAAIDGLELRPGRIFYRNDQGDSAPMPAGHARARLYRRRPILADDIGFLRTITDRPVKAALPAPSFFHFGLFDDSADRDAYPDLAEFHADLLAIYRQEMLDLQAIGCEILQLDEHALPLLCDPLIRDQMMLSRQNPDRLVRLYTEMAQAVCQAAPPGFSVHLHLCRGTLGGLWGGSGGYEKVAEAIFTGIDASAYLLEYDTDRAGDFAPLRHLPRNKMAYLGLLGTSTPEPESRAVLRARLGAAARHVSLDQVGLCPHCGFMPTALHGATPVLNAQAVQRKLAAMCAVADEIWGGMRDVVRDTRARAAAPAATMGRTARG